MNGWELKWIVTSRPDEEKILIILIDMGSWGIWNHCKIDCWPGNDFEKWLAWCDDSIMMMTMKMRWCQTTSRKLGGECIFWKAVYGKKHISYWSFKNKMLFTPRHFRRWGGLCAHTRKKKNKTKQNVVYVFTNSNWTPN